MLISIDTLRADHLSCYGYRKLATPHIDALARDGTRYESAYAQAPLTLPSHATLLTGLLPYEHGVRDNIGFRLSPSQPTLARRLREAGYATGAAVSCYLLRKDRGLAQGFDFYDDQFGPSAPDERAGDVSAERLERWMDSVSSHPLLALLHVYEPHAPYAPPEPFATIYALNPYDGEIAAADAVVGRFLEFLRRRGLYDRAVVVLLSDHGEGLNDHGEEEHGVFLYREAIRVPLILKLPGSRQSGRVVSRPVGLCDVAPTLSALLGLRPAIPGVSLLDPDSGAAATRRIYSESLYPRLQLNWSELASLIDGRNQYIEAPRPELYDLQADPQEKHDLAAGKPAAFRSLRLALASLTRPGARPEASSPEELKRLASLGYVRLTGSPDPAAALPDPKDRIAALRGYKKLLALFYGGRDAEAIALARELLAADPGILSAWRVLAQSLARSGRFSEAVEALHSGIARTAAGAVSAEEAGQAYEELARLLARGGHGAGAESLLREALDRGVATEAIRRELARIEAESGHFEQALALLPSLSQTQEPETLATRGGILAKAGRLKEAGDLLTRALAGDPENSRVLVNLANLSLREKDPAAAKGWAERAIRIEPRAAAAWSALGAAQAQLGEEPAARESWSRAVAEDPSQYDALFNLAVVSGRMGRVEEARRALERFLASAPAERYGTRRADAKRLLAALRTAPGKGRP